jgi:hypothetical protein
MSTLIGDFDVDIRQETGVWQRIASVRDNWERRRSLCVGKRITGWRIYCLATHGERFASIVDLRIRTRA